jgi:hypothetical protein
MRTGPGCGRSLGGIALPPDRHVLAAGRRTAASTPGGLALIRALLIQYRGEPASGPGGFVTICFFWLYAVTG